ncbi:type VI secretion system lipoprotein TssJ [Pseudomonas sp. UL073]|uniref:Type VI secretion system lipoprotein TssJ n=1 Tax=Zestomonas insulae TaxID=2809017 RepID=A0ABS2IJX6_9GAMM|nr:type VI secretion system lipoprotein TssJ [Pseudomonas insulae]MBM7063371.1 type VI secretion system lipoprotein TssJ [Pseudomonas insulae]
MRLLTAPLLCGLLALSGCAAVLPYSELTKLDLSLRASEHLNPDLHGRPSPIVVRLIELKHPVAFENADFFALYQNAKETLLRDRVAEEELELRPGATQQLKLSVQPGSRYVGVLAAYRDLPEARWRYVITLEPRMRNRSDLQLDALGIQPTDSAATLADEVSR